jgi:DNA-binding protein
MILNYRAVIKRIGNFIAEVRKQQNMTQRELAEKIGVSDKTISKWETGKSMPELGVSATTV